MDVSVVFTTPVLVSLAAAGFSVVGLIALAINAAWARSQADMFAAFAAGALIAGALLHLLPEAYHLAPDSAPLVLAGFAGAFFLNRIIGALSHSSDGGKALADGLTALIAMSLHSFVDGVVYAVVITQDEWRGAIGLAGLVLHEVPEAIITFTLLTLAGVRTRLAMALTLLAAGLTTPAGAILATPYVAKIGDAQLAALFALAAGILLYLGTVRLLPHAEKVSLARGVPALLLGAAMAAGALLFHDHDHGHGGHDHAAHGEAHGHDHDAHDDHSAHDHADHAHDGHDHDKAPLPEAEPAPAPDHVHDEDDAHHHDAHDRDAHDQGEGRKDHDHAGEGDDHDHDHDHAHGEDDDVPADDEPETP